MKLRNLKKAPFEIATLLASNDKIIRLLCDDNSSALITKDKIEKSIKELIDENYINFYPAVETGIDSVERNTFIIINMEDFNLESTDNNIYAAGSIFISTDKAHALLNDNALRLLELCDEIEVTLHNKKLSSAGELVLTSINYVVFSEFRNGYRISFTCTDQSNRKAEL